MKKIYWITAILVIALGIIAIIYIPNVSSCCRPRTGINCKYCPGISDNECHSWLTSNKGVCVTKGSECANGYKRVIDDNLLNRGLQIDKYRCSTNLPLDNQQEVCCLPNDFIPKNLS